MAQVDYFLKIDGVDAESADKAHKGEIALESFSWGQSNSGTAGHGGGGGAGKVNAQDFSFVKKIDKSSPVLMIACATGKHYPKAVLSARKAGDGQQDYLKITMEDVLVSSYQTGGAAASDIVPMDQITLNFAKLEMSYKEQMADGSLGGEVKQKYDYAANVKI
jgi:type VI secretion system secreted protein Hcp